MGRLSDIQDKIKALAKELYEIEKEFHTDFSSEIDSLKDAYDGIDYIGQDDNLKSLMKPEKQWFET